MLKIGDISLDIPIYQAPLSGYTEWPMRVLAREYGAPLTFTGVLLDKIALHPKAVKKLRFQPGDDEHPVGAQILGSDPDTMTSAARSFVNIGYDIIDINIACPAPKVLRRRRGGYLINTPETAIEIYRRVRDAVKCPVMMKLRIGFDSTEESRDNFWKICKTICEEGIDALAIHGRTVNQKYRKNADWNIIREVKQNFPKTLIIGSGDILDAETCVERLKTKGVDGVLIARGAIGNPWIFNEIRALLEGKNKPKNPGLNEQKDVMLRHYEMICKIRGEIKAVRFFRKFIAGYCKRHPQRKKVQLAILDAKTKAELLTVINHWYI